MRLINHSLRFWNHHPALFYGVSSLLGFYCAFYDIQYLLFPLALFFTPYLFVLRQKTYIKPLIMSLLILFSSLLYGKAHHHPFALPTEGVVGEAYMEIESVSEQSTYFGKNWMYRCHLRNFYPSDPSFSMMRNIKCTISLPQRSNLIRPLANQAYLIKGQLEQSKHARYYFKIDKKEEWLGVQGSWSLAELRYGLKQQVMTLFKEFFRDSTSAIFLSGLMTGEFDDRIMQSEFARFGLQHIMAISGFHFSVIAGILSLILRIIVPRYMRTPCVLIALTAYFLFLGNSASILRSWIMIVIALTGEYFGKNGSALNSLGVALLVILLIDPLLSQTVGFQFSFLATAAILLCFSPINFFLESIFPKRPLSQMKDMNKLNQHGYCLLAFFRQGLALALAINIFVAPISLYYFHQFSYMSLFYNFFFPLFVSLSLFLLLIGLIFSCVFFPLGQVFHSINNVYTQWILNLIYNLPHSVDVYYEAEEVSLWFVVVYVCLTFMIGIHMRSQLSEKRIENQDLAYI